MNATQDLKEQDRVTITGHSPVSVGTIDSLNACTGRALVNIDGVGFAIFPIDRLVRVADDEHKRIQRAAAQSMADQGYTVTCQGRTYSAK